MSIIITDHSWSQDSMQVCLSVPLHGVPASKADVLHTEKYVKISFAPFLFEVLLYDQIDPLSADVKFEPKRMFATFAKAQPNHEWPQLNDERQRDRDYMKQVRREAVDRYLQIVDERDSKARLDKHKLHHDCVREQMTFDGNERERIKAAKSQVINDLERELEAWKRGGSEEELVVTDRHRQPAMTSSVPAVTQSSVLDDDNVRAAVEHDPDSTDDEAEGVDIGHKELSDVLAGNMQFEDDILLQNRQKRFTNNTVRSSGGDADDDDEDGDGAKPGRVKHHPVRNVGGISVEFTPRVFPTPERESARQMEDEWLLKQSEARAVVSEQLANLRPEERDPLWLLSKATKLEQTGDYNSAYEALNYAIRLSALRKQARASRLTPVDDADDDQLHSSSAASAAILPQLWLGRARCQLKRRNLHKCIEDCSTAIEHHLVPACEANRDMRGEAHLIRGNALLQLDLPQEALVEINTAYDLLKSGSAVAGNAGNGPSENLLRQSVSEKDGDSRARLLQCAALLGRARELVEKGEATQTNTSNNTDEQYEELVSSTNNTKSVTV